MFSNGSHLGLRVRLSDINLKGDHPRQGDVGLI